MFLLIVYFVAAVVCIVLAIKTDYKKTFGIIAGILCVALVCNFAIKACTTGKRRYTISTAEEFLNVDVSNLMEQTGEVDLTADIDFAGIEYKTVDLSGGNGVVLDGNGHTVKNITLTVYEENKEFGIGLLQGWNVTVKNITFENVTINYQGQASAVGGVMGKIKRDTQFENVKISGKINAPNSENVGSFVGNSVNVYSSYDTKTYILTVKNCESSMEINGKENVGGIIGNGALSAQSSKNTGDVNGKDNVGGIVGKASGNVSGVENYGKVESAGIAGGIVGYAEKSALISKSKNGAEIVGAAKTGGIVGVLGENASIDGCVNLPEGKITASSKDSDGFAKVGGIVGTTEKGSNVFSCTNQGEVVATYSKVGGVVGYSLGGVTNCKHEGKVTGADDVGGIIGHMKNNSTVSSCIVTGTVTGGARVGGIMGRFGSDDFSTNLKSALGLNDITIMNCSVSGEITANSYGGGLIGLIVNDTVDGEYLETNTFDGKLTVGGAVSTNLWVVELKD